MGGQISTDLNSGCFSREQRYLDIKSKADLGRCIEYANKSTMMVINFTSTWCQPCIDAEPPMRKLAKEFPDVKFYRVDIDLLQNDHTYAPLKAVSGDNSQDVVTELDLKTMPTFLLCKKVDEVGGGNGSGNRISSANNVKEGNSVVPSAIEDKRTTSIKGGNSVVASATEGKSADSVKEGNRAAAGATGRKSGTGVERANSASVNGSKGESTTANAKEGQPSPKRRAVNYAGKKVFIDEIDRMEGPVEGHELRKKIESYKNLPTTASFKSTDEFYSYLEKSKPNQLMVINFTTEWCGPCKKAEDPFKKIANDFKDVKFAKVDVDVDVLRKNVEELGVKMMPTFLLVKVKKLEKEHVKKDGVQGDRKEKKEPPVLDKRYQMVELYRVVGWNKEKEEELRKMIEEHRYSAT